MKKRRLAAAFSPDAVQQRVDVRKKAQDELDAAFSALRATNLESVKSTVTEDQALVLLSSKLTFRGTVLLKMALDHVPSSFGVITRGTKMPLRFSLVKNILEKNDVNLSETEVQNYASIMERCCPVFCTSFTFDLDASLWNLTKEGNYNYNRFIGPPVESCLHCDDALTMSNQPSKAIVYGTSGPLPATKVTLSCNRCKTKYGVGGFSDEKGKHLYPKKDEANVVEASNVTYVDRNLYKWIPSLGNHCWVSFSGFSEAYNGAFSDNVEKFRELVGGFCSLPEDNDAVAGACSESNLEVESELFTSKKKKKPR